MDEELFQLCKSTYEKTGWDGNKQFAYDDTYADKWLRYIADFEEETREKQLKGMVPLYTSDYLLSKLESKSPTLTHFHDEPEERRWGAVVWTSIESGYADTPLKALLRLVIALKEAGANYE